MLAFVSRQHSNHAITNVIANSITNVTTNAITNAITNVITMWLWAQMTQQKKNDKMVKLNSYRNVYLDIVHITSQTPRVPRAGRFGEAERDSYSCRALSEKDPERRRASELE